MLYTTVNARIAPNGIIVSHKGGAETSIQPKKEQNTNPVYPIYRRLRRVESQNFAFPTFR